MPEPTTSLSKTATHSTDISVEKNRRQALPESNNTIKNRQMFETLKFRLHEN